MTRLERMEEMDYISYKVVRARTQELLDKALAEFIAQGWSLTGDPVAYRTIDSQGQVVYSVIVKKREETRQREEIEI